MKNAFNRSHVSPSLPLESSKQSKLGKSHITILVYSGIFLLYLVLRLFVWQNTILLEDTDSLFYLESIKKYLTFNLQEINTLNPDSTPFYPFFGALCTLAGFSVETGARLCSFIFSLFLFWAVFGITKQKKDNHTAALALLILTFSPPLISLSVSILTEPSYIATVYLAFWFFLFNYENPKSWTGAVLGILCALAFLNRTEGVLYLILMPFLQGLHFLFVKERGYSPRQYLTWTLVFTVSFVILAGPQILHVSKKMGTFAINGRQAWRLIDKGLTGYSDSEKIFGLHFSERHINIKYAKLNYSDLKKRLFSENKFSKENELKLIYQNIKKTIKVHLRKSIGISGLALFLIGIMASFHKGLRFHTLLFMFFMGFSLLPPLTQTTEYLLFRHILVIYPIIFIFQAAGIIYICKLLLLPLNHRNKFLVPLSIMVFLIIFGKMLPQLAGIFNPPAYNKEYSIAELKDPADIVKQIVNKEGLKSPVLAAQRGYLSFFSECEQEYLPYCDYRAFVKWCSLNNVEFVYLNHRRLQNYPFFKEFVNGRIIADFQLLYGGSDMTGKPVELFRFRKRK